MIDVATLYEAHAREIRTYLARRLPDDRIAEELAQDVWLRVIRHADRYTDTGAPVEAWLFRIVRNLLTDHYRERGRRVGIVRLGEIRPYVEHVGTPDHDARIDARDAIEAALPRLTAKQRETVVLWDLRGYDGDDGMAIGALLGMGHEGVKTCRRRGLANLRKLLGDAA